MTVAVHGWGLSPSVRAVCAALHEKGVPHEMRGMTPADLADPAFRAISPFGKVPVLEHPASLTAGTHALPIPVG